MRALVFFLFAITLFAKDINLTVSSYFTKGYRIVIDSKIVDDVGVYEARVYFKERHQKVYHYYCQMVCKGDKCMGLIPTPQDNTKDIDYFVLYQNNAGNIYKSDTQSMSYRDMIYIPKWQKSISNNQRLKLYTELEKVPNEVYGFSDYMRLEQTPLEFRLGYISGVYDTEIADANSSKVVKGLFAGDISASTTDLNEVIKLPSNYTDAMVGGGASALLLLLLI